MSFIVSEDYMKEHSRLRESEKNLQSQLRIARETLEGIRDHEHCNLDGVMNCADQGTKLVPAYSREGCKLVGICQGHRCASKLAAEGLKKMEG